MTGRLIVVADRVGARIFSQDGGGEEGVALVEVLANPAGRKKSGQIDADAPGVAFSKGGVGGGHPMAREESAHQRTAANFAREIAERLRAHRTQEQVDDMVLVAEPRFLGLLQGALDRETSSCVGAVIRKDLCHLDPNDLGRYLSAALR